MKIALAQVNPTVGDLRGNRELVLRFLERAQAAGADLCVFPELCLAGYPPNDLLERESFVRAQRASLDELRAGVGRTAALVGFVDLCAEQTAGRRLYNAAALLHQGALVSVHHKSLLPTYDVFDEQRHFRPAHQVAPVRFAGRLLGVTICEDVWNDPEFWPTRLYPEDPVACLCGQGAELLVNLSASPFTLAKRELRPRMLRAVAAHHQRPLLFVNQVGGNDDLVFDGHSLAFAADGRLLARGRELEEDLLLVDLDAPDSAAIGSAATGTAPASDASQIHDPLANQAQATFAALVLGTRDYARKCGFARAVIGLSGGIDSSLVAAIAAAALGPANVLGVSMPSRYTSEESRRDARELARRLGIELCELSIEPAFAALSSTLEPVFAGRAEDVTEENLQARVRGTLLMALSNKLGHLPLATGNKSELAVGYCTLYGDMVGGLAVIGDLPKTMVYEICRQLNRERPLIPEAVLSKPPSAELRPKQRDEDSLPPYPVLDAILEGYVEDEVDRDGLIGRGFDAVVVDRVLTLLRQSEYKRRQAAPTLKLTSKAFGPGRRMPIAQKWPG